MLQFSVFHHPYDCVLYDMKLSMIVCYIVFCILCTLIWEANKRGLNRSFGRVFVIVNYNINRISSMPQFMITANLLVSA